MAIQNPIDALNSLNDAISKETCIPKEPFVKLGIGEASILNYNLPQATCYRAYGEAKLNIDIEKFKPEELAVPANNFWDVQATRTIEGIRVDLDTRVNALPRQDMIRDAHNISARSVASAQAGANISTLKVASRESIIAESIEDKTLVRHYTPLIDKDFLAVRIKQGYMPLPYRRFSGVVDIRYIPKPPRPKPQISIVLHYKMCSYLGDYGAGQTIKTFSLLPGEKMDISIKHYLRNENTKKQTQHVLDSFSESAADDLQNTIENESTHSDLHSETGSFAKTSGGNIGGNLGLNVGVFSLGIQGGYSSEKTTASSLTDGTQDQMRDLQKAVSTHVSKADTLRQIDVNTESTNINISEDEETIKRSLENYNKSRVLNFVFRQLLQEYFTITYLDDVTFSYSNGYPEKNRTCRLSNLEEMLSDVLLSPEDVRIVKAKIFKYLCSIYDVNGDRVGFIEEVNEVLSSCIGDSADENISYVRKRKDLMQTYRGKTVDGIIINTAERIIRTSSLVVDALLGQGEALDCYNQKLQDANAQNAYLGNLELVQKISMIEEIGDPMQRAEEYKKVFGACCTTPQTQVIS